MYLLWCTKCRNQICMLRYNIQNCVFLLSNKVCKTQDLIFLLPIIKWFFLIPRVFKLSLKEIINWARFFCLHSNINYFYFPLLTRNYNTDIPYFRESVEYICARLQVSRFLFNKHLGYKISIIFTFTVSTQVLLISFIKASQSN